MTAEDEGLNLLLAHADDNEPVLEGGLPQDAAGDQEPERGDDDSADSFYDPGASGNDVGAQGWSVIAPEGKRGDELLARIKPLIDHRAEQLEEELKIYRVPSRMSAEEAMSWRQGVYNDDDPDLIPRYQLILGDLHEVPYELQAVQAGEGYVGRLAFSDPEGYESYVDKLLNWERSPLPVEQGKSLFYSVHDGTAATRIGYRGLIEPVVAKARAMKEAGRFNAGEISEIGDRDEPSPDELLSAASELEAGVLFTMSHGCGAPRRGWGSNRAQRSGQGAMSFGREGSLPARELERQVFVPGGIWFMFACFGAGTPERSKYHHWLDQLSRDRQFRGRPESVLKSLPKDNQRPFIAALPQAALASPEGPLAFVGHLDLAWTYSFTEMGKGKKKGRADKFYNILKSLLRGDRVGMAMLELMRFYNDKNQELTDLYDLAAEAKMKGRKSPVTRAQMGHLWMVRQDLAGYILLGDPAAKLPIAAKSRTRSKAEAARPRGPITVESVAEKSDNTPAEKAGPASSFSAEADDDAAEPEAHERGAGGESAEQVEQVARVEHAEQATAEPVEQVEQEAPVDVVEETAQRDHLDEHVEQEGAQPVEQVKRAEAAERLEHAESVEQAEHGIESKPVERSESIDRADDAAAAAAPIEQAAASERAPQPDAATEAPPPGAASVDVASPEEDAAASEIADASAPDTRIAPRRTRRRGGELAGEAEIDEAGDTDPERPIRVRWRFSWRIEDDA